jgi:hypothetical protein
LRFTLDNVGTATVPFYQGDEYVLSMEWDLDSDSGASYEIESLPGVSRPCGSFNEKLGNAPLTPGTTITGCLAFDIGVGIPVKSVSVTLLFAGHEFNDTNAEWLIP